MCPFGGGWLDGRSGSFFGPSRLICHVLLVETDHDGLVLVDSGLGLADIRDPNGRLGPPFPQLARPVLEERETAVRQVEALGFSAADVRHVVMTHMDLDHANGLSDFPSAVVHLLASEHAAIERPRAMERKRYRPIQWAHRPRFERYDTRGEPWRGFACVRDLEGLPPELLLVPLTGHTRGHCAVAVESDRGWLLHAGDAYFHCDQMNVESPSCPPGLTFFQSLVAIDRGQLHANQARLRELVRDHGDEVRVFSAHDVSELDALQAESSAVDRAPRRAAASR